MKIFILVLVLLISPCELRQRNNGDNDDDDNNEIYQLDDLFNQARHRFRPEKQQYDNEEDGDDQYVPSLPEHRKTHPSKKKVLDEDNDDEEREESFPSTESDSATCVDKYAMRSEQLVKVRELKDGAHMIRYVVLDKRTISPRYNLKEHCMIKCCEQKNCDLAMLSEQATHEGHKCYLFACNGSCPLASHQDYTIMFPKADPAYFTQSSLSTIIKEEKTASSTMTNVNVKPKKSFFRDTSVIIFLIFGLISTIVLVVFLIRHFLLSRKRGHRGKNYAVDADYLINGLYL